MTGSSPNKSISIGASSTSESMAVWRGSTDARQQAARPARVNALWRNCCRACMGYAGIHKQSARLAGAGDLRNSLTLRV